MSDDTKLIQYAEVLLVHLGYDTDSPTFRNTARRYAAMLRKYEAKNAPEYSITGAAAEDCDETTGLSLVPLTYMPIRFEGMCARHFMPIKGVAGIMLVPDKKNPPLSSLSYLVKYYTEQFIDQQSATLSIGQDLIDGLSPRCLSVIIKARHSCEAESVITTETHSNRVELARVETLHAQLERYI
jgi:GTP cyclohydrolase IA